MGVVILSLLWLIHSTAKYFTIHSHERYIICGWWPSSLALFCTSLLGQAYFMPAIDLFLCNYRHCLITPRAPSLSFLAETAHPLMVSFTKQEYTVYTVNGKICGDEISLEVFGDKKTTYEVEVTPKNGTGRSKYFCLYWYKQIVLIIDGYNCSLPSVGEDFELLKSKYTLTDGSRSPVRVNLLTKSKEKPWDFSLNLTCIPKLPAAYQEAHVRVVQGGSGCKLHCTFDACQKHCVYSTVHSLCTWKSPCQHLITLVLTGCVDPPTDSDGPQGPWEFTLVAIM